MCSSDLKIAAADEAKAVCRALRSSHIRAVDTLFGSPLHKFASFFQSVESDAAYEILGNEGLPLLRQMLIQEFERPVVQANSSEAASRRNDDLFLLKILAMYGCPGDGPLIVRMARHPGMREEYLWSVVFDILGKHPDALSICDALRNPLLEGFVGVAYLDFANSLARNKLIRQHPFNSEIGVERLLGYLADPNPENYSYAQSAAASIPFVDEGRRKGLFDRAIQHPDAVVQLEAAWALAKTGAEVGHHRLAEMAINPRFALRAIEYLEELGAPVPEEATDPDFRAMAEMSDWLSYPSEFGRPPDEISLYDTRVLNWPPTDDERRLWLIKYRYEPRGDADGDEGIGLVGSATFALFGEVTADMPAEDVYGLHCCWELEINQDSRAPEERSVAAGREILAKSNPGFLVH